MANVDAPFGFVPLQPVLHRTSYRVLQTNTYRIGHNDLVARVAAGTVQQQVAGNTEVGIGSVEAIFDANGVPVSYVPASCGAAYTVVVADDPNQLFMAQDDGDTTQLALTDEGANALIIIGNCNANTGRSIMEIDSSSAGATVGNGQIRLMRKYAGLNNAIGANCIWIVKLNLHQAAMSAGAVI